VFAHACQQPVQIGLLGRWEGEGFGRSSGGAEEGFAGAGDEQRGDSGGVRLDTVCVDPPAGVFGTTSPRRSSGMKTLLMISRQ